MTTSKPKKQPLLEAVVVPKELYYHEVAYVRGLETALAAIAKECSTFPIKDGLAFRCESIALIALGAKS